MKELQRRLCDQRLLILTGPPHSGKTSLVFGGMIPQLKQKGYKGLAGTKWRVAHFIPSNHTVEQLTKAIARRNLLHPDEKLSPTYQDQVRATLRKGEDGLIQAYQQSDTIQSYNFLIVLDQCEAFFSKTADEDKKHLIQLLLAATQGSSVPIYVLMVVRDQSLSGLTEYPALARLAPEATYRLHLMSPAELKEAIEGPLRRANVQMEEEVSRKLLEQLIDEPTQLMGLQSILFQLWKVWYQSEKGKGKIMMKHFRRASKDAKTTEGIEIKSREEKPGIQIGETTNKKFEQAQEEEAHEEKQEKKEVITPESNAEILEQIWLDLPESDQMGLMKMFKAMTQKNKLTKGRLEKRTVMIEDLANIIGLEPNRVIALVNQIRTDTNKVLLPEEGVLDLYASIELAELGLVADWPRLNKWIEEEETDANQFLAIARAANEKESMDQAQLSRVIRWWEVFSPMAAWGNQYYYGFEAIESFIRPMLKSSPDSPTPQPPKLPVIQESPPPALAQENSPAKPPKPKIKIKGKRS